MIFRKIHLDQTVETHKNGLDREDLVHNFHFHALTLSEKHLNFLNDVE